MKFRTFKINYFLSIAVFCGSLKAYADQFHYQNFLIGDRAIGLGGAYGAVSDDASGVYYNPAGIAFALSNDISGSANAMYNKTLTFKKTIGAKDFKEESGGTVPSFFGGLLKVDNIAEGLVFAWGIYALDNELKDQDDLFSDVRLGGSSACPNAAEGAELPPDNVLKRFHRTVNSRSATEYVGAALGWRMSNALSFGVGANYISVDELVQEYQDVKQSSHFCTTDGGFEPGTQTLTQNIRQSLTAYGIQPVLGVQASLFGRLSLGFTAKFGSFLSQAYEQTAEIRRIKLVDDDQSTVEEQSVGGAGATITNPSVVGVYHNPGNVSVQENPLGSMANSYRLGVAYFASTRLLMTADLVHVTGVNNAEKFGGFSYALYGKEAVTNFMAGLEYYLVPAVPMRLGFFTNNDARPDINKKKANQRNHVDWFGGSVFFSWVQPNSQIGAGFVLQNGAGEAQKIGGVTTVQKVEGQSYTFAFSATTTL
ncbi:MAG: hypothetical protein AB8G05_08110 [Oligoflexales bacterium]